MKGCLHSLEKPYKWAHLAQKNLWNRLSRAVYALPCGRTGARKPVVSGLTTEPKATVKGSQQHHSATQDGQR